MRALSDSDQLAVEENEKIIQRHQVHVEER
jgi:hypothetical protein